MDRRKLMLFAATVVAAIGTILVFLYVQGADARAVDRFQNVEVLRAVAVIEPGETIDSAAAEGKLKLEPIPETVAMPNVVASIDALVGESANTRIYPGEQIVTDKFGDAGDATLLTIPDGKLAITVQLTDTSRVAGFIKAGSRVAIFLSGSDDNGPYTRLLLPDATVIAVGSTTPTAPAGEVATEVLPSTLLTLALDQGQAERIMFGTSNGELSFALRNSESSVKQSTGVTSKNLFG